MSKGNQNKPIQTDYFDLYQGSDKAEFKKTVLEVSERLKIPYQWILGVFYFESKLNPKAVNKSSGASGLFQLMPRNVNHFNYTIDGFRKLSGAKQTLVFEQYMQPYKTLIKRPLDAYLAVFYPAALKWNDTREFPDKIEKQNPAFVSNHTITRLSIARAIDPHFEKFGIDIIADEKKSMAA